MQWLLCGSRFEGQSKASRPSSQTGIRSARQVPGEGNLAWRRGRRCGYPRWPDRLRFASGFGPVDRGFQRSIVRTSLGNTWILLQKGREYAGRDGQQRRHSSTQ